eukprot:UN17918
MLEINRYIGTRVGYTTNIINMSSVWFYILYIFWEPKYGFKLWKTYFERWREVRTRFYDMKGSTYKREVGKNPIDGDVLKDLDFRLPVLVSEHGQTILQDSIHQDSQLLKDKGLMDYSLLLGIKYKVTEKADKSRP